jgi:hypothetical protein
MIPKSGYRFSGRITLQSITAQSVGAAGLHARLIRMGEAMIARHVAG